MSAHGHRGLQLTQPAHHAILKGRPAPQSAQRGLRDRHAQGSRGNPRSRPSCPVLAPAFQRAAGEPTATPGPLSRPPGTSSQRSTVRELVPACVTDRVSPPHHRRSASPLESRPCYSCTSGQEQSPGHTHKTHAGRKREAQETGRCCRSLQGATGSPAPPAQRLARGPPWGRGTGCTARS